MKNTYDVLLLSSNGKYPSAAQLMNKIILTVASET